MNRLSANLALVAEAPAVLTEAAAPTAIELHACTPPADLARLEAHSDLDAFRPPDLQLAALIEIAGETGGCVATAVVDGRTLIGYAAFHRPSAIETWGDDRSRSLIELGAVEVVASYRGLKLAERLLETAFADGRFTDTVVFATLYRWHYDLERTGLGELGYRRMLERLYGSAGFVPLATGDPEIGSHPANRLMVRIGDAADPAAIAEFERLRLAGGDSL